MRVKMYTGGEIEIRGNDAWTFLDLLASLNSAGIDRIAWVGEEDRETMTYGIEGIGIKLSTKRVKHELTCVTIDYDKVLCRWTVNGSDVGTIVFNRDEYPISEALGIIEDLVKSERVADNEVKLRRGWFVGLKPVKSVRRS